MQYLGKNLDNSLCLPYDVLRDIYEYADILAPLRKQIKNKEYDLEDTMYKRMKKYITKNYFDEGYLYYLRSNDNITIVTPDNINNPQMKEIFLNGVHGYRDMKLWKHKRHTHICGLEPNFPLWYRDMMIKDLNVVNPEERYDIRNTKQLYQLWKNL